MGGDIAERDLQSEVLLYFEKYFGKPNQAGLAIDDLWGNNITPLLIKREYGYEGALSDDELRLVLTRFIEAFGAHGVAVATIAERVQEYSGVLVALGLYQPPETQ